MPAHASRRGASMPPDARPLVDVAVLEDLVGDDPDVVRRFLDMFLRSARTQADQIAAACAAGDSASVRSAAHKLKASSWSIGASPLGDLCAELEIAGARGEPAEIVDGCRRFERAVQDVEAFIARRLDAA